MSRALTQAGWEAKAIFRNGEQLMVTFLLPILALLVLLPAFGNHGLWAALMVLNGARGLTMARLYPRVERAAA